jgi:hypothetical protein
MMHGCILTEEGMLAGVLMFLTILGVSSGVAFAEDGGGGMPSGDSKQEGSSMNLTEITFADVAYGPHPRNTLDFWKAKSDTPTPLLVVIHGGGFYAGSKENLGGLDSGTFKEMMLSGISVASINYRLTTDAGFPAQMLDAARAVQFLRSKAKEWNLDPARVAASGGSAGGGISLWLAFHDDLADPKSEDPVERQSTRLTCAAVQGAQTSYDPRFFKSHFNGQVPLTTKGITGLFKLKDGENLNPPPDKARLMEEASPITHATADDPPVLLEYDRSLNSQCDIHHPVFGQVLKARLDELKVDCIFQTMEPGWKDRWVSKFAFLIKYLKAKTTAAVKNPKPVVRPAGSP